MIPRAKYEDLLRMSHEDLAIEPSYAARSRYFCRQCGEVHNCPRKRSDAMGITKVEVVCSQAPDHHWESAGVISQANEGGWNLSLEQCTLCGVVRLEETNRPRHQTMYEQCPNTECGLLLAIQENPCPKCGCMRLRQKKKTP